MPELVPIVEHRCSNSGAISPMIGAGEAYRKERFHTIETHALVRHILCRKPRLKMRRSALPELSGPKAMKKLAGIVYCRKSASSLGDTFLQADPGINVHFDSHLQHSLLLLTTALTQPHPTSTPALRNHVSPEITSFPSPWTWVRSRRPSPVATRQPPSWAPTTVPGGHRIPALSGLRRALQTYSFLPPNDVNAPG